ncbi:hypothetical protein ACVWYH_001964 [Bradyrhizobium sp. GM24.11]
MIERGNAKMFVDEKSREYLRHHDQLATAQQNSGPRSSPSIELLRQLIQLTTDFDHSVKSRTERRTGNRLSAPIARIQIALDEIHPNLRFFLRHADECAGSRWYGGVT